MKTVAAQARANIRAAPYILVVSLALILATFAFNKLYWPGSVLAPIPGLFLATGALLQWKTGEASFDGFGLAMSIGTALAFFGRDLTWSFPQTLAIAAFFYALLILLFKNAALRWIAE